MTILGSQGISFGDNPSTDAFGRLRVSNPQTIFDSKNVFDDPDLASSVENLDLLFDNQETSGTGTSTSYDVNTASQILTVTSATAGTRVRQTRRRFNYQPGKSQLVLITFNMNGAAAGVTKREGLYDENDGIFFELDGTTVNMVKRSSTSGSPVDTKIAQANWNIDTMDGNGDSGITLDLTRVQIMFIDIEWLGVGRVRTGFVVDGLIYYVHEFKHANILTSVYMQTPNLPIRSEIINSGAGTTNLTLTSICCSIMSEGGVANLGTVRHVGTNGTHVDLATENVLYGIIGLRLRASHLGLQVNILKAAMAVHTATDRVQWLLVFNPTITGTFTFSGVARSGIEAAVASTTPPTITNGYHVDGGFLESGAANAGAAGSTSSGIDNALKLGSLIDGTRDTLVLCARPIGGSSAVDVEAGITWRELT